MKIAIVVRNLSITKGGLERYTLSVTKMLVARGHQVEVFAHAWDEPGESGVRYHRVPGVTKPAWLRELTFHWGVNRRLNRSDYDIVLGSGIVLFWPQHVYRMGGGIVAASLRRRYPPPLQRAVAMLLRPVLLVNWWMERQLMAGRVSYVVANSAWAGAQAQEIYGLPSDRLTVLYNGMDPERFRPRPENAFRQAFRRRHGMHDDAVVLLFISHNFRLKGLDQLIEALPVVVKRNPRTWVVVVGRDDPAPFIRQAKEIGVERRLYFMGTTESVEDYYSVADIFVLPTRFDPFANVCLEAMACGLPVVTTRSNGAAELIEDGRSGYVVDPTVDAAVLADRICRLLNPAHRAEVGREAARVAQQHTIARHLDELEAFFQKVQKEEAPCRKLRQSVVRLAPDLTVNGDYLALLTHHGLDRFEALMGTEDGALLKDRKGKRIFQLRLEWQGNPTIFYLKRHRLALSWFERLRAMAGWRPDTEGGHEWERILAFHGQRLPTVTPVAMGERIVDGEMQESFVMTEGLVDYESLELVAPKRFVRPLSRALIQEKRALIRTIAGLSRLMHWSGFFHRDYYLAHFFTNNQTQNLQDLRIIDLQRVLVNPWVRSRWLVKDIASLYYTTRGHGLTRTDRLRFLQVYNPSLTTDRRFQRNIMRKAERIDRHVRHKADRRAQNTGDSRLAPRDGLTR